MERRYRAGESIEDYCRACKTDRMHVVIAVDADARPIRVSCGYCRSDHNYRGGPRVASTTPAGRGQAERSQAGPGRTSAAATARGAIATPPQAAFPIVSEHERTMPMTGVSNAADLELLLRRVIREEAGVTAVAPAEKWRGGSLVLRPGNPSLQEKVVPIETFFHKVVMLRNRLRTLEQVVNASELPEDSKIKLQSYISGCYGSLTTFNVLFADEADQFKGTEGS
jgi:hypothetical protein